MAVTRIDTQDIRDLTIQEIDISTAAVTPGKANLSGSSVWVFQGGLSGSIQRTSAGLSYIVGGTNIQVVSSSGGQITISNNGIFENIQVTGSGTFGAFVSVGANLYVTGSSFLNAISGSGLTLSGPGNLYSYGTGTFALGISGSLTRLSTGVSYLVAGTNVTITSASNGQITISASTGSSVGTEDFIINEIITGSDGVSGSFSLANEPSPSRALSVYKNGLRMLSGSTNDYILSGTGGGSGRMIYFMETPQSGANIVVDYLISA